MKSLAVKYRPAKLDDVVENDNIKKILYNQVSDGDVKHGYLFCGSAGCGKTTVARIFANMINETTDGTIELDAASNNSVDNIRDLCEQSNTQSITSKYKVFIIDECHSLSNQAWQAMLKTLEEPSEKSIFIFCTTNPEKIPKTILSRVQRYNFSKISTNGIVGRLKEILKNEGIKKYEESALYSIANHADGGMRDAITYLDMCLSYSKKLDVEAVNSILGLIDYEVFLKLSWCICMNDLKNAYDIIEDVYNSGIDLSFFIKSYMKFILEVLKFGMFNVPNNVPNCYFHDYLDLYDEHEDRLKGLLNVLMNLYYNLKYESDKLLLVETELSIYVMGCMK